MTGKFFKTEEGMALLIAPAALEAAGINVEGEVDIAVVEHSLVIQVREAVERDQKMQEIFQKLLVERADVYENLAQ